MKHPLPLVIALLILSQPLFFASAQDSSPDVQSPAFAFCDTDLPFFGQENASVTIDVFNDYQCPYCKKLAPVLEQVLAKYCGQIKLVFKNFPLPMHRYARLAAAAALAADRQEKF